MVQASVAAVRTVIAVVVQGLMTFFCGSYLIVLMKIRPRSRQVPRIMRIWAKTFLFVTGTKVTVTGGYRLDPASSYVVVGNHTSNLDIPVIMGKLPVSTRFLAKKELFGVPVLGGAMRSIHMVETDRHAGPAGHRAINEQVARVIGEGLSLMIFPEGTRATNGGMLPFKKGAFRIAVDNAMPIVPVTIVGAGAGWRAHSRLIFGGPVRLIIHEPIGTAHLTTSTLDGLRDRTRAVVASGLDAAPLEVGESDPDRL